MLHPPNSTIWIPTLVLQQGTFVIPYEVVEQNAKKSGYLDPRHLQNIPLRRNQSISGYYPNQIPSLETC